MLQEKILIAKKLTKYEWDKKRFKLDDSGVLAMYKKEGLNPDRILISHKSQLECLDKIRKLLPKSKIINRDDLKSIDLSNFDLIISYGGDNNFLQVVHNVKNHLVMGINSDPKRSVGALTSMTVDELDDKIKKILNDDFSVESWSRLSVTINGKKSDKLAVSEIFIGEEKRLLMSRHILSINGVCEEQKGSGLVISTGAGSTGWYNSASCQKGIEKKYDFMSRDSQEAAFILTEPYKIGGKDYKMNHGKISKNDKTLITSLSDTHAVISLDSITTIPLKEGNTVTIGFDEPLRVLVFK